MRPFRLGQFARRAWVLLLPVVFAGPAAGASASSPTPALVGIAVEPGGGSTGAALITCDAADAHAHARLVAVGDLVCGLTLVDVRTDAVTLQSPTTNEVRHLSLPLTPATATHQDIATSVHSSGSSLPAPHVSQSEGTVHISLSDAALDAYLSNLPALLTSAVALPHMRETDTGDLRADGFEVSSVRQGGLVEQLGIRAGDVVLEVNGAPFTDLTAIASLLSDLRRARHASVGVRRGTDRLLFILDIQ